MHSLQHIIIHILALMDNCYSTIKPYIFTSNFKAMSVPLQLSSNVFLLLFTKLVHEYFGAAAHW